MSLRHLYQLCNHFEGKYTTHLLNMLNNQTIRLWASGDAIHHLITSTHNSVKYYFNLTATPSNESVSIISFDRSLHMEFSNGVILYLTNFTAIYFSRPLVLQNIFPSDSLAHFLIFYYLIIINYRFTHLSLHSSVTPFESSEWMKIFWTNLHLLISVAIMLGPFSSEKTTHWSTCENYFENSLPFIFVEKEKGL